METFESSVSLILPGQESEEHIRNDQCPICIEKFKVGDQIIYACEAKHLHHTQCYNEMKQKNHYSCSVCRSKEAIEIVRKFRPGGVFMSSNNTHRDDNLKYNIIQIPIKWCCVNIACPFIWMFMLTKGCCTKQYIIDNDNVVNATLVQKPKSQIMIDSIDSIDPIDPIDPIDSINPINQTNEQTV